MTTYVAYRNKSVTLQSCVNTARYICTERERWVWVHQLPFAIQRDAVNFRTLNFKRKCAKKQNIPNIKARERPYYVIHVYGSWKNIQSHLWFILWNKAMLSFNTERSLKSKAKGRSADLSCANANIRWRCSGRHRHYVFSGRGHSGKLYYNIKNTFICIFVYFINVLP